MLQQTRVAGGAGILCPLYGRVARRRTRSRQWARSGFSSSGRVWATTPAHGTWEGGAVRHGTTAAGNFPARARTSAPPRRRRLYGERHRLHRLRRAGACGGRQSPARRRPGRRHRGGHHGRQGAQAFSRHAHRKHRLRASRRMEPGADGSRRDGLPAERCAAVAKNAPPAPSARRTKNRPMTDVLPVRAAKKPRRVEERTVFLLVRDGRLALRKRVPPRGCSRDCGSFRMSPGILTRPGRPSRSRNGAYARTLTPVGAAKHRWARARPRTRLWRGSTMRSAASRRCW